jgi:hypothetical protein
MDQQDGLLDKIMMRIARPYFWKEYYGKTDLEIRQANRTQYWGSVAGNLWHEEIRKKYSSPRVFQDEFVARRESMTLMLERFINAFPGNYTTFCEIGTGNGLYITYLYDQYHRLVKKWIGIDLNSEQIRTTEKIYGHYPIKFISTEISDWVNTNEQDQVLFLTAGTLEYFTQTELEEFLLLIKTKYSVAAIALIEPVSFDLSTEHNSTPRGSIMFNHNYPYLLKKAGFNIFEMLSSPANPDDALNKSKLLSVIAYI